MLIVVLELPPSGGIMHTREQVSANRIPAPADREANLRGQIDDADRGGTF